MECIIFNSAHNQSGHNKFLNAEVPKRTSVSRISVYEGTIYSDGKTLRVFCNLSET